MMLIVRHVPLLNEADNRSCRNRAALAGPFGKVLGLHLTPSRLASRRGKRWCLRSPDLHRIAQPPSHCGAARKSETTSSLPDVMSPFIFRPTLERVLSAVNSSIAPVACRSSAKRPLSNSGLALVQVRSSPKFPNPNHGVIAA